MILHAMRTVIQYELLPTAYTIHADTLSSYSKFWIYHFSCPRWKIMTFSHIIITLPTWSCMLPIALFTKNQTQQSFTCSSFGALHSIYICICPFSVLNSRLYSIYMRIYFTLWLALWHLLSYNWLFFLEILAPIT